MSNKKPNIIFMMSDDQGAWAMHCAGNSDIITPNLDRLAEKSVLFDNFYCVSPVCSPARASIVTGEIPSCHGVHDWLCGGNINTQKHLHMREKNAQYFQKDDVAIEYLEGRPSYIAELAKNGYSCSHSGKWHLGNSEQAKEGYKQWLTISSGACEYYKGDVYENGHYELNNQYITDVITDKALGYLDELLDDEKNPFYLSVHYTAPHSPWDRGNHPDEYLDMYKDCEFNATPILPVHKNQIYSCMVGDTPSARREHLTGYYASITAMDYNIGKILDKIENSKQNDNTIIIFTADNGMNLGQHGVWGKGNGTYPPNMYDSSVKVPFIMHIPNSCNKGEVDSTMLNHCDIFPTLLKLADVDYSLTETQIGKDFSPIFQGKSIDDRDIFVCDEYGFVRMLRTETHKIVLQFPLKGEAHNEFYDLTNDPDEAVNLIDNPDYAHLISDMSAQLNSWFDKYTIEQNDGRKSPLTGSGQSNWCYKEGAFVQEVGFYHKR